MVPRNPTIIVPSPNYNPIRVLKGLVCGLCNYTYNGLLSTLNLQVDLVLHVTFPRPRVVAKTICGFTILGGYLLFAGSPIFVTPPYRNYAGSQGFRAQGLGLCLHVCEHAALHDVAKNRC